MTVASPKRNRRLRRSKKRRLFLRPRVPRLDVARRARRARRRTRRAVVSLFWGAGYLAYWTITRRPSLKGIAATIPLVTAIGAGSVLIAAHQVDPVALRAHIRMAADEAYTEGKLDLVDLYWQRIQQFDPRDPAPAFQLGLIAEQRGDVALARSRMREIASDSTTGYGPAHLWLARDLAKQSAAEPLASAVELEHHLAQGLAHEPANIEANELLGQLYLQLRRYDECAERLERVVTSKPMLYPVLADSYILAGNPLRAEQTVNAGISALQNSIRSSPGNVDLRVALAAVYSSVHRYSDALQTLESADEYQNNSQLKQATLAILVRWFDLASASERRDESLEFKLLKQAFEIAPGDSKILTRLTHFAVDHSEHAEAQKLFSDLIVTGQGTSDVYLVLGTKAAQRDQLDEAVKHLEEAVKLNPSSAAAANNLAYVLSERSPSDLDRALELADLAVKLEPRNAEHRETRGQILAKLGKDREAISELELALKSLVGRKTLHAALATLYARLGDPTIAAQHSQLAE